MNREPHVDVVGPDRLAWLSFERAEKVPELVARSILREIVSGDLQPGDMLPPESVMLERFGVGRASLREALGILEIYGLIRIKPGPSGGPMVDTVSSTDYGRTMSIYLYKMGASFQELFEARIVMEPVIARLAARRRDPEMADQLRAALQANHDALSASAEQWAVASENFHEVVAAMSGNGVLDLFSESLVGIHRARIGAVFPPGNRGPTLRAHDRIADAILTGQADAAERISHRHLTELAKATKVIAPHMMDELIDWG